MKRVYLDHAATTPLDKRVLKAMQPYWAEKFGNPSSIHVLGHEADLALTQAREQVTSILHCHSHEIIFTAGGTEANNLALRGVAEVNNFSGHVITSAIEHPSVLDTAKYLATRGVDVTFVGVDEYGRANPADVIKAIRPDTFLISLMYANNEIGTIQPIAEIGKEARRRNITMHTDAVQAPGLLPLDVEKLHVDLLSLSGHKFYGPKGVGLLYRRRGVNLVPQQIGGAQEFKLRASTENVPGIIGLAQALSLAEAKRPAEVKRLTELRDWLITEIKKTIPQAVLTGHPIERLANNISFCFPNIEGESLILRLSERGFDCSSGSACTTGSLESSHVLLACGLDKRTAFGSLRISLGHATSQKDLQKFVKVLHEEVAKLA